MASTRLGDIPGARFHAPAVVTNASAASGGANARIGQFGPFQHNVRVRNVDWAPTSADQGANTASYRRLSLYNGGTAGTVTATASRIGSLNLSASKASLAPVAFTVDTTVTVASGAVLYFSQETVGGAEATGTVLQAGTFAVAYEII